MKSVTLTVKKKMTGFLALKVFRNPFCGIEIVCVILFLRFSSPFKLSFNFREYEATVS